MTNMSLPHPTTTYIIYLKVFQKNILQSTLRCLITSRRSRIILNGINTSLALFLRKLAGKTNVRCTLCNQRKKSRPRRTWILVFSINTPLRQEEGQNRIAVSNDQTREHSSRPHHYNNYSILTLTTRTKDGLLSAASVSTNYF